MERRGGRERERALAHGSSRLPTSQDNNVLILLGNGKVKRNGRIESMVDSSKSNCWAELRTRTAMLSSPTTNRILPVLGTVPNIVNRLLLKNPWPNAFCALKYLINPINSYLHRSVQQMASQVFPLLKVYFLHT